MPPSKSTKTTVVMREKLSNISYRERRGEERRGAQRGRTTKILTNKVYVIQQYNFAY